MDSFHTGGVAASRGGASVDKFTRLNQLLELPKVLPNSAVLANTSGKVTKIERDMATNGWNVHVGKEHHYVPAQRTPTYDGQPLVVGTEVKKGDPITDGHINPRDYLKHTDIHTVQNYLTNELYNGIYKDERVRRRNIETVVRSLTNYTQIKDPGDSHHLHGDYALRTVVEEHNRNLPEGHRQIEHQPVLKGAQQMALNSHEDWMARLNFQQLRNTLLEGTAKGWKTDLHGTNPIPAYAFGAEFGLGTSDKEHHY
jgi:DNA-directed RNA polymerase subunit beta'